MNRDNFMLILLISSAVLTVHQWVMERESNKRECEVPDKMRERGREKEGKKGDGQ